MNSKRAFTLIELLVVIAIIGILSGFIVVSMSGATNAAKDGRRKADIDTIRKALLMYSVQNGNTYPVQSTQCSIGSNCSVLSPAISSYLPSIPTDPNGTYYTYQSNGNSCIITAILSDGNSYQYSCLNGYSIAAPCNGTITFSYNGGDVTYGLVASQAGECWMDRNLGASQVATAYNDSAAYGHLFQWGRQVNVRGATTTTTLSSSDNPGHTNFIYGMGSPYDWRSPQNDVLWQGVSGINNPCPSGWRVPTQNEWQAEIDAGSWTNHLSAYNSSLKLTSGGYRGYIDTNYYGAGNYGLYWTSTLSNTNALVFFFYSSVYGNSGITIYPEARSIGHSLRCIRN